MSERSYGSTGHRTNITFSKFKYKLQILNTEFQQLQDKERIAKTEIEFLTQKRRNVEAEHQQKCAALHAELVTADEIRLSLENKVKDLQNDITTLTGKQKDSKELINGLLQSRDNLTNDLKTSNYVLKCDIMAKDCELAVLKEKLCRNSVLFEAVERETICVKLAVDETRQLLSSKEDEVFALKQSLDKITGYEKLFIEKIQMLENKVKENQIEHSRKDNIIADLKEQLDSMMNDHKLEMEIETLQRSVNAKEEAIQNLLLEKEAQLSQVESLELVLAKFQEMYMEKACRVLSKSQEAASVLHNKTPKVQEMIVQEPLEECKRCEEENHHNKSVKLEFVAPVCDLKEKNTNIDSIVINKETVDLEARTSDFSLLPERKPSTPERRDKYQKESLSTNEVECRNENVYRVSRGQSQCDKTFTLFKESLDLAASKKALSLQQSQDKNVQKSSMPNITQVKSIKIQENIAKYSSVKIKPNDSILMKSYESDYSAEATKNNDLCPHALTNSGSSHSSSSSLSTNGASLVLVDEVLSQSDVTDEKRRALDLAHENEKKTTNIMEEHKQVPDLEYLNALETVERKTFCIDKNNRLRDPVYQAVFVNATNSTTVAEKHKPVTDLACQTAILNSTIETRVTERRKFLVDLANNTASCNVENVATGREDKYEVLDSNFQNITNVVGENEEVLDAPDQPGVKNSIECDKLRAEKEQELNSEYLTVFQNATKTPDMSNHAIAPDRMNKRVVSPLVDGRLTTGLKVKERCPTISKDGSLSLENTFKNSNDTQTSIIESSQGPQNSFDDNLQLCAAGSSPTLCLCNGPLSGHMVNCAICQYKFHAGCVMLESKDLNQELSYTCDNCKTGNMKKRRKIHL